MGFSTQQIFVNVSLGKVFNQKCLRKWEFVKFDIADFQGQCFFKGGWERFDEGHA